MLPLELIEQLEAPPGFLLVERIGEPSLTAAGIIIPDSHRAASLSSEAVILSSSIQGFEPGERVLLTSSLTKPIVFGMGRDKREIYRIFPRQCLCKIHPDLIEEVDTTGRDPMALWTDRQLDMEPRRDEGDPEGIR